ncbi:DUF6915 family protein [Deinococcus terrestris]|uniref:DUF6915 family protein n=1 Tax=Deinococcus terrestris TaxID=2651870 RepID=UPI0018838F96|nr:hypothetical protein [Deinococcus terrestris]
MSHAIYHAQSSARRFGGVAEDYLAIHEWFDASKAFIADARHRALRHHAQGIFWCEEVFGRTITNSAGRQIPVRLIGEQHVLEDFRRIPSLTEWLEHMTLEDWMFKSVAVLPKLFKEGAALPDVHAANQPEQLQVRAEDLTHELALINGRLHRAEIETLLTQHPQAVDLKTQLVSGQVSVVLRTANDEVIFLSDSGLPHPCLYLKDDSQPTTKEEKRNA